MILHKAFGELILADELLSYACLEIVKNTDKKYYCLFKLPIILIYFNNFVLTSRSFFTTHLIINQSRVNIKFGECSQIFESHAERLIVKKK